MNDLFNKYNNEEQQLNELNIVLKNWSFSDIKGIFSCEVSRKELYNYGVEKGNQYYNAVFKNCDK